MRFLLLFSGVLAVLNLSAQQGMAPFQENLSNFNNIPRRLVTQELLRQTPPGFQSHPEFGVLPFDAQCSDCIELIDKRTPDSRYFIKNGTGGNVFYVQKSYGPMHYYD